jgi:hypothetical protein
VFNDDAPIVRLRVRPLGIDIARSTSAVPFEGCYPARVVDGPEGAELNLIDLLPLKVKQKAAPRQIDLHDLGRLPQAPANGLVFLPLRDFTARDIRSLW